MVNMYSDDRTECIGRILETLGNPLLASPSSMEFGDIPVDDSSDMILTINNIGDAELTITDISVSGVAFSSDWDEGDIVLEPDDFHELTVTFAPTSEGEFSGQVTITSDVAFANTLKVHLNGMGGTFPNIIVSEDTLDFGENVINCGPELELTISNDGQADLIISDITVVGDYFSDDFVDTVTVEPDSSYDLTVTYQPEIAGNHTGTLTLCSNDLEDNELDVHLMGSAIGGEISEVGSYDTPGYAMDVFVLGDYAYVADGDNGLCIIDVSNPASPSLMGICDTDGWAHGVSVSGDYAYVGDWGNSLRVVDVSDPEYPVEVGHLDTPGNSRNLEIIGDVLYLADCTWGGVRTVDISDPDNPVELGFYDTDHRAWDVSVWDTLTFVSDRNTGLLVFNTSDLTNLSLIGSRDTPCDAYRLDVVESYAYVADRDSGFCIIDVSDPTNPIEAGTCKTNGDAYCVTVIGDYAFLAIQYCGLCVVDVSDPANPSARDCYSTPGYASGVTVIGNYAYVADAESGLQIFDVSYYVEYPDISATQDTLDFGNLVVGQDSDQLSLTVNNDGSESLYISHIAVNGFDCSIDFGNWVVLEPDSSHDFTVTFEPMEAHTLDGTVTITSNDPDGIYSVVLSGAGIGTFTEVGSFNTSGFASHIVLDGNYGFIANGESGLCILDITDPQNPSFLGCYDTDGSAMCVVIRGSCAYLADGDNGLLVIDISDIENLDELGSYNTPGTARAVDVLGDYAFVADGGSGLCVIDISDPSNPDEVGSCDTPGNASDVTVRDDYAYVADGDNGLRVIDVRNPANPIEVGYIDPDDPISGVDVRGNYAYLANGLRIIDISNPQNPNQVGFRGTAQNASSIVIGGTYAYIADAEGGFLVFDISNPTDPDSVGGYDTEGEALGIAVSAVDERAYIADADSGLLILDVSNLEASVPNPCPRKDYVMIGIPVAVPDGNPEELFGEDFDNTSPGSPYWRISRWDAANARYIRYHEMDPEGESGDPADFTPGLGFWVSQWAVENCVIDIRENQFSGIVPQDQRFRLSLSKPENGNRGLNMLANPFHYTYDWRTTYFDNGTSVLSIAEAGAAGWISSYAYTWDNEACRYIAVNFHPDSTANYTLDAWQGFWLEQMNPDMDIDILFTPDGYGGGQGLPPRPAGISNEESWALNIEVISADGEYKDKHNKAGISSSTEDGYDCFDAMEYNPMAPNYVQMYFHHPEWSVRAKKYTYDYRSIEFDGVKTWDFTVRTWNLSDRELTLSWSNLDDISTDFSFSLKDLDTETVIEDLRSVDKYTLISGSANLAERHFRLSVTSSRPSSIVRKYGLIAAYPNPFNDRLYVSFNLPSLQNIQLKVFDIQGREVAVIDQGKYTTGLHHVSWDAGQFTSGLYYIHLETSEQVTTKKVVLVR